MAWNFGLLGVLAPPAAGEFNLLETQVLTSNAASVTFTGLDAYSDYKHLQLRATVRDAGTGTDLGSYQLNFNSDTGSNYSWHKLQRNGPSVSSTATTSSTSIEINESIPKGQSGSGKFGAGIIDILDFASTTKNTTVRALIGAIADSDSKITLQSGLWIDTSAVTSVALSKDALFATGSRFSLYGVK